MLKKGMGGGAGGAGPDGAQVRLCGVQEEEEEEEEEIECSRRAWRCGGLISARCMGGWHSLTILCSWW